MRIFCQPCCLKESFSHNELWILLHFVDSAVSLLWMPVGNNLPSSENTCVLLGNGWRLEGSVSDCFETSTFLTFLEYFRSNFFNHLLVCFSVEYYEVSDTLAI